MAYFSSTLCWLWEKSPDIWQKVSVVKKHVFLESPALWARRRSFNRRAAGREKDVVEAKLCKVTSVADVIWTGLTLTVSHHFFLNLRKSMANVWVIPLSFTESRQDSLFDATWRKRSGEFVVHGVVVCYLISFIQFTTEYRLACHEFILPSH